MTTYHVLVDGSDITIVRNPPNHLKEVSRLEQYCLAHYGSQAYSKMTHASVWFGFNLPAPNGHGFYAEWAEISVEQLPKEVRMYLLIQS